MKSKYIIAIALVAISLMGFIGLTNIGNTANAQLQQAKPPVNLDSLQPFLNQYADLITKYEAETDAKKQQEILKKKLAKEKAIQSLTSQITGSKKLNFKGVDYYLFVADMDRHEVAINWKDGSNKPYKSISNLLNGAQFKKSGPLMICNAGMYNEDNSPKGLYIENVDKELVKLDTKESKAGTNFYLLPNGVFYIDSKNIPHVKETKDFADTYTKDKSAIKLATQSGPMLVINRKMHNKFTNHSQNLNIRNGVGVINQKKVVFAISYGFVNFYDFASFYKDVFDCENALYLDGAISRMYLQDLNPNEKSGNFGPMISVVELR